MEKQVAHDLLKRFLEKRSVGPVKGLEDLIALGYNLGVIEKPAHVFDWKRWREIGNNLWERVIDEDKVAKKLMKPWRDITNDLKKYQMEKDVALQAQNQLDPEAGKIIPGADYWSPPPGTKIPVKTDKIPAKSSCINYPTLPCPALPDDKGPPPPFPTDEIPVLEPSAPLLPRDPRSLWAPSPWRSPEVETQEWPMPPPGVDGDPRGKASVQTIDWKALGEEAFASGDREAALEIVQTFPVFYETGVDGQQRGEHKPFNWKMLQTLRQTAKESGPRGELTKQILDYIFSGYVLCPEDVKRIMRLILTPSQQMLWQSQWQQLGTNSQNQPRAQGNPLHGVRVDQLMGTGNFSTIAAQAECGAEILQEAMRTAKEALSMIKIEPGPPTYTTIKQGPREAFSEFIDRLAAAFENVEIEDRMKAPLMRQCALDNCNPKTRAILSQLPINSTLENMLERMSRVPTGEQAFLTEAMDRLGEKMIKAQENVLQAQQQALAAALAPLREQGKNRGANAATCFRCGEKGHMRSQCQQGAVWCPACQKDNHSQKACRRSGNGMRSASQPGAPKQIAAPAQYSPHNPFSPSDGSAISNQPPAGASAWTWQQQ
ncbi:endogenous retrovirus group K member 113 Gag polyprotein-like [Pogoniulus pusillus]|uniref:endogenous retrovirus group K member 113 Gag polyprotein-like n=1 Tax=Pogoniulus pusillus TaxID=488313 RepID=UPI0030B96120